MRRWIDANLVRIGIWSFVVGVALIGLTAAMNVFPITGGDGSTSVALMLYFLMVRVAQPLTYVSALLIGGGVLLRNWRVTLVGFENSPLEELMVHGPDEANVVWIGKRYENAFDAEAAANALANRLAKAGE